MATLVENAVRIKQTFDDIHDAIIEQGVTPVGGVETYADAIDSIAGIITPPNVPSVPYALIASDGFALVSTTLSQLNPILVSQTEGLLEKSSSGVFTVKKSGRYFTKMCWMNRGTGTGSNMSSLVQISWTHRSQSDASPAVLAPGGTSIFNDTERIIEFDKNETFIVRGKGNSSISLTYSLYIIRIGEL